jgi:hypothetical protein
MNTSRILQAGLLTGTLDIAAALIQYYIKTEKNPEPVLKFIASGVFGNEAFSGGSIMSLYGLIFHFIIAFAFTLFFFWVFPKMKLLSKNRILTGIGYGIFIWLVMNLLVLPLSKTPKLPFTLSGAAIAIGILIVCIGLPLAFLAKPKPKQQ